MARLEKIATHPGVVKSVKEGFVAVEIAATSACASCEAHSKCGFAESKNKTIDVPTADWQQYHDGDSVTVCIDESRGLTAVWWAYVLPAVLMLAAILALSASGAAEWIVALAALAILGIYTALLYAFRRRLDSHFTITVTKMK